MRMALKLLTGAALAMLLTLSPNTSMSGGEAWAQTKKGCECMNFCKTGSSNKCITCRNKCS